VIAGFKVLKVIGGFFRAWWPVLMIAGVAVAYGWGMYSMGCERWQGKAVAAERASEDEAAARARDAAAHVEELAEKDAVIAARDQTIADGQRLYEELKRQAAERDRAREVASRTALARQAAAANDAIQGLEAEVVRLRAQFAEVSAATACHDAWAEVVQ